MLAKLLALTLLAPSAPQEPSEGPAKSFEELEGFKTVLLSHINAVLGSEHLPSAMGLPVEPGVFVTLTMERVQVFDRNIGTLQAGRLADGTVAAACKSGCAAVFFNAFSQAWEKLSFEAAGLALEVPTRVLLAAHADLPARTLVEVAYAAAETRPVQPPFIYFLLNSGRAGLRAQQVFLVPPEGLTLARHLATLGLTVRVAGGSYAVTAADPRFGRQVAANDLAHLIAVLKDIKKRYPGKETIILQPEQNATVRELVEIISSVRDDFPAIVISGGQRVVVQ
jgi:hypothetical protein